MHTNEVRWILGVLCDATHNVENLPSPVYSECLWNLYIPKTKLKTIVSDIWKRLKVKIVNKSSGKKSMNTDLIITYLWSTYVGSRYKETVFLFILMRPFSVV